MDFMYPLFIFVFFLLMYMWYGNDALFYIKYVRKDKWSSQWYNEYTIPSIQLFFSILSLKHVEGEWLHNHKFLW